MEKTAHISHYVLVLQDMMKKDINSDAIVVSRHNINGSYAEVFDGVSERRVQNIRNLKGDEKLAIPYISANDFKNGRVYIGVAEAGTTIPLHIHTEHEEYIVLKGRLEEKVTGSVVLPGERLNTPALKEHELYYPQDSLILIKISYDTKSI